jgi:hypothetical protein
VLPLDAVVPAAALVLLVPLLTAAVLPAAPDAAELAGVLLIAPWLGALLPLAAALAIAAVMAMVALPIALLPAADVAAWAPAVAVVLLVCAAPFAAGFAPLASAGVSIAPPQAAAVTKLHAAI